jgi:protein-S-isoprenylcysteine O-methyltransferase Ste14
VTPEQTRARFGAPLAEALARRRVTLGFLLSAFVFWLASPSWRSLAYGLAVAAVGEALRLWAAGHIEKSREVTQSGPYRFLRHPLYAGSTLIGAGVAVGANSAWVAVLVGLYLATTIPAAIRSEESHLREKFGGAYDAYARGADPSVVRRFSIARALANREHHTVAGLVVAFALLALKAQLSVR